MLLLRWGCHVHGALPAGILRPSTFCLWARKKSPFRHAWLPLHFRQIRSPTHSLSNFILHLRHRRGLRSWSPAGWIGLFVTYSIWARLGHLVIIITPVLARWHTETENTPAATTTASRPKPTLSGVPHELNGHGTCSTTSCGGRADQVTLSHRQAEIEKLLLAAPATT